MVKLMAITALSLFLCLTLGAQETTAPSLSYYLPGGVEYDAAIPTPEQFFGFQVGDWHLQPQQIHAYIRELARLSDRITVETMGESHEQREIILATITSPENQSKLPELRSEHLALSDPARSGPIGLSSMPVVVWMGYSVHGNEASGSNASVLVAYYLAAARGVEIESLLSHAIVLLNPSINPDGLNRFASWVNANKGKAVDPSPVSREHQEPWPGGRTNHYWFDLNRDWMPLQHPESKARIDQYYEWRPNVLTDHHEMGTSSTFFFQPGIPTRNNPLVPPQVGELTSRIASFHARALDSIGSFYYSEESFDDFYIGKGSSYPDITGGVGILFEQASARGHAQKAPGGIVTFPFAIRNHVTTSFSTLRAAVRYREDLLAHQREMARSALRAADGSRTKAYVFGSGADRARSRALAELLQRHQIETYRLKKDVTAGGKEFHAGKSYVVPVRQVQFRLITSLFERRTTFEDSLFYDVSAWSLPLAFGLPYGELRSLDRDLLGEAFDLLDPRPTERMPESANLYAFEWTEFFAPRALERLFAAGITPRMALEPFSGSTTDGAHTFAEGTIVVAVEGQERNTDQIRSTLEEITSKDGIHPYAITSGQSDKGIDLGSPNVVVLERPSIALLAGPGISPTSAGEVWHLFDERYRTRITLLDPADIRRTTLADFTVLIMPAGWYRSIDSQQVAALTEWIRDGNTMIALENAVTWIMKNKLVHGGLKPQAGKAFDTTSVIPYRDENKIFGAHRVPGAIVSASADLTHPLLFGFSDSELPLFKTTPYAFLPSNRRAMTPVLYSRNPLVSGYLHQASVDHAAGAAAIAVGSLGRGHIVLFADDPVFRAYWLGTSRILSNAVYVSKHINVP